MGVRQMWGMAVGTLRVETDEIRALAANVGRLRAMFEALDRVEMADCAFLAHADAAAKLAGALNDWDRRRRQLDEALDFLASGLRLAAEQYDALEARIIEATRS